MSGISYKFALLCVFWMPLYLCTHTHMMMHTSEHRARGRRMKRWSDGALARWREWFHNHVRNEEHHSKDKKHIMKQKNLRLLTDQQSISRKYSHQFEAPKFHPVFSSAKAVLPFLSGAFGSAKSFLTPGNKFLALSISARSF